MNLPKYFYDYNTRIPPLMVVKMSEDSCEGAGESISITKYIDVENGIWCTHSINILVAYWMNEWLNWWCRRERRRHIMIIVIIFAVLFSGNVPRRWKLIKTIYTRNDCSMTERKDDASYFFTTIQHDVHFIKIFFPLQLSFYSYDKCSFQYTHLYVLGDSP